MKNISFGTHSIGFARKMKGTPGKLCECLEEDGNEGVNVFSGVFRRLDGFAVIGIRETHSNP